MNRSKNITLLTLLLAACLMLFCSASGYWFQVDGPSEKVIGFPFVLAKDGANSLEQYVYVVGLQGNFAVYFVLVRVALSNGYIRSLALGRMYLPLVILSSVTALFATVLVLVAGETYVRFWWGTMLDAPVHNFSFQLLPLIG